MDHSINNIIIIHPSELVLQGFSSFFNETSHQEIILLKHPDSFSDYPYLSGQTIILISTDYITSFENKINNAFPDCTIKYIEIKSGNSTKASADSIHINENKASILDKIKKTISSFNKITNEKNSNDLSKREIDVLMLLTKGHSNKEIADKLFISTHTVITHRKNISEKTGIRSASGLTMFAVLKKIIDINDISTSDLI